MFDLKRNLIMKFLYEYKLFLNNHTHIELFYDFENQNKMDNDTDLIKKFH